MKLPIILTLGAVLLATPVFAQSAANSNNASASVTDSSAASIVSAIPDTEKQYKDSSRARDFRKEAETTKALNQQIASANNSPTTQQ